MVESSAQPDVVLFSHDCDTPVSVRLSGYQVCYYTHRSINKDTDNEDALLLIPFSADTAVLAVTDGLGGQRDGAQASRTLVETLYSHISAAREQGEYSRASVLDAIEQANQQIMQLGSGAATTLALVELLQSSMRTVHIGDSDILLTGQRGKLKFKTIPHSPVGYMIEAGMLDSDEALHHEDRHIVSNCVGVEAMHMDIGPVIELAKYDTLLLASDGVFDNLSVEQLIQCVRKGSLQSVARRLLDDCLVSMRDTSPEHHGKPDDLSFILVRPC